MVLPGSTPLASLMAFFHELSDDQGVGAFVDHLLFQLRAFEVDFFDLFALQDQFFLVFQRNGALADALHLELGLNLHDLKIAEVRRHVVHGFFEGVGKGRQTVFTVKKLEGVVIDDVGRCGRQAQGDGFEIVEHFAIGVVDGAVAFIDDDEIEKMRRQVLRLVPNDVEHRGIGGDIDAAVFGNELFAHIGPAWLVGQMLFEGSQCLLAQRDAVDQKQHLFGMTSAHQGIDHGNAGAGLAGAGGHDQQKIALLLLDAFQHRTNGADLVVATGNRGIDELLRQRFAVAADVVKALQIVPRGKADDFARRGIFQIPEVDFQAIGIEAERQLAAQLASGCCSNIAWPAHGPWRHRGWFSWLRSRPGACGLYPAKRSR